MPVVICLLRGVNVGGHHQIRMDALRETCESLGLEDARTYVQSGNVVFRTGKRDILKLSKLIEGVIEETVGFRPAVILRTTAEMRDVVKANPFADRGDIEPNKLVVLFLASKPGREAREMVQSMKTDPEELHAVESELYIYFPDGMGRSKLQMKEIEKALRTQGTARNWNTVTKLLEISEQLESRT